MLKRFAQRWRQHQTDRKAKWRAKQRRRLLLDRGADVLSSELLKQDADINTFYEVVAGRSEWWSRIERGLNFAMRRDRRWRSLSPQDIDQRIQDAAHDIFPTKDFASWDGGATYIGKGYDGGHWRWIARRIIERNLRYLDDITRL